MSCLSRPPHLLVKEGVNGAEAVGASGVEGEVLGGRGLLYNVAQSLFLLWVVLGEESPLFPQDVASDVVHFCYILKVYGL